MNKINWKGFYLSPILIKKFNNSNKTRNEIKTDSRKSIIIPKHINTFFKVYNGKSFSKIKITDDMIGYKLGEFVPTRKKFTFKKKKKKR